MSNSNSTVLISTPAFTSTSTSFSFPSLTPNSSPSTVTSTSAPPSSSSSSSSPSSSSSSPSSITVATFSSSPETTPTPTISETPSVSESPSVTTVTSGSAGSVDIQTVLVTKTASNSIVPTNATPRSSTTKSSSSVSSGAAAFSSTASASKSSGSLGPGGKIAVAVVVPLVAVALIVLAGVFLWRKRKQRKHTEELRRKEVEEYGFNPNNDPTLPAIGITNSNGDETSGMNEKDGAGYRGWGTTSTARNPSTTLSSGNGQTGIARSDSGSNGGGYPASSPTLGTDVNSGDPLVGSPGHRPETGDSETIGALGAAPAAGNRQDRDINRGPSNASSAYSGGHRSDTSADGIPGGAPGPQYYNEGMYYDEGIPQHGPYGDVGYNSAQPVIRDVQARRNTRIENPAIFPQQGNAGIAQNF